jgi:beta-galactosidase
VLDYLRFISVSTRKFAKMQADIIRKYLKPGDFITTNGLFGNLDNHQMTKESLDFMTYDSYPNFAYCLDDYNEKDLLKDRKWSRNLTETRSTSPIFGIMEQQSGANGWNTRMEAPTPRPGQLTLWTMQSIAHGADYVSYFRWRTCTFGTEIYWHGILDYSSRENRRIREVREVNRKLNTMQEVAGARFAAKVAILKDYDNIWDAQVDKWHERVENLKENESICLHMPSVRAGSAMYSLRK